MHIMHLMGDKLRSRTVSNCGGTKKGSKEAVGMGDTVRPWVVFLLPGSSSLHLKQVVSRLRVSNAPSQQ